MYPHLAHVGYFISPVGGAGSPATIREDLMLLECITRGEVLHPETGQLSERGTLFLHSAGEQTVHQAPSGVHYECLTASFRIPSPQQQKLGFPRSFLWKDLAGMDAFTREVLHAAHYEEMNLQDLGEYIWSTLRFRLKRHRRQTADTSIPEPVTTALRCIESEPGREWRLEDLAKTSGWSTSHLHAEFKRATGKSPHQVLVARRMAEARHRLVRSRDPVKRIAFDVGFANTENFCRVFKKVHGQTALSFRNQYQILPKDP